MKANKSVIESSSSSKPAVALPSKQSHDSAIVNSKKTALRFRRKKRVLGDGPISTTNTAKIYKFRKSYYEQDNYVTIFTENKDKAAAGDIDAVASSTIYEKFWLNQYFDLNKPKDNIAIFFGDRQDNTEEGDDDGDDDGDDNDGYDDYE